MEQLVKKTDKQRGVLLNHFHIFKCNCVQTIKIMVLWRVHWMITIFTRQILTDASKHVSLTCAESEIIYVQSICPDFLCLFVRLSVGKYSYISFFPADFNHIWQNGFLSLGYLNLFKWTMNDHSFSSTFLELLIQIQTDLTRIFEFRWFNFIQKEAYLSMSR